MSAPDTSCYDYVIGLYNGDCDCLDGRPTDYNQSDSGLYISDLLEPKMIDGLLNCDQGDSVWELMEIVRELAVRYFIADSNALLSKANKLKRKPYYGGLGLSTYTKDLSLVTGYAGVKLLSPLIRSGYIKIKKIGVLFNSTQAFNLTIIDRNGTVLYTIALNSTANVHTINTLATPITLPLYDDYLDCIEYHFQYSLAGFQPKNNQYCCSCEKTFPCWGTWYPTRKHPWTEWISVGGFNSTALPDYMNSTTSPTIYMNGLTFEIELGCLVNEVFCKDQLDFTGNTLAQAMAVAIQRYSAMLFIDKILTSPNLNRQILIDREQLVKSKEEWKLSYQEMIAYIVENIDITANDCFECRDIIEMIQGGIMA